MLLSLHRMSKGMNLKSAKTRIRKKAVAKSDAFKNFLERVKTKEISKLANNGTFMKYSFRKDMLKLISERLSKVFPGVSSLKIEKDLKELLQRHGRRNASDDGIILLVVTLQEVKNLLSFISPTSMQKVKELLTERGKIMKEIGKYVEIDVSLKKELDEFFNNMEELVRKYEADSTGGDKKITTRSDIVRNKEVAVQTDIIANSLKESDANKNNKNIKSNSIPIPSEQGVKKQKLEFVELVKEIVGKYKRHSGKLRAQLKREVVQNNVEATKSRPDDISVLLDTNKGHLNGKKLRVDSDVQSASRKYQNVEKLAVKLPERTGIHGVDHELGKAATVKEKLGLKFLTENLKSSVGDGVERYAVSDARVGGTQAILSDKVSEMAQNFSMRRVYPEVIVRQIIDRMDIALANGQKELIMELYPPHLGKLRVQIMVHGNDISANFWTPFNDVKAIIESGLGYLQQHFQEHGMNTGQFSVYVGSEGSYSGGGRYDEHQMVPDGAHYREAIETSSGHTIESTEGYVINLIG